MCMLLVDISRSFVRQKRCTIIQFICSICFGKVESCYSHVQYLSCLLHRICTPGRSTKLPCCCFKIKMHFDPPVMLKLLYYLESALLLFSHQRAVQSSAGHCCRTTAVERQTALPIIFSGSILSFAFILFFFKKIKINELLVLQ